MVARLTAGEAVIPLAVGQSNQLWHRLMDVASPDTFRVLSQVTENSMEKHALRWKLAGLVHLSPR